MAFDYTVLKVDWITQSSLTERNMLWSRPWQDIPWKGLWTISFAATEAEFLHQQSLQDDIHQQWKRKKSSKTAHQKFNHGHFSWLSWGHRKINLNSRTHTITWKPICSFKPCAIPLRWQAECHLSSFARHPALSMDIWCCVLCIAFNPFVPISPWVLVVKSVCMSTGKSHWSCGREDKWVIPAWVLDYKAETNRIGCDPVICYDLPWGGDQTWSNNGFGIDSAPQVLSVKNLVSCAAEMDIPNGLLSGDYDDVNESDWRRQEHEPCTTRQPVSGIYWPRENTRVHSNVMVGMTQGWSMEQISNNFHKA
jgi:hypothetical protein